MYAERERGLRVSGLIPSLSTRGSALRTERRGLPKSRLLPHPPSSSRPPSHARGFYCTECVLKSFCKGQFPHKSVNLFFTLRILNDKLTDLWGS